MQEHVIFNLFPEMLSTTETSSVKILFTTEPPTLHAGKLKNLCNVNEAVNINTNHTATVEVKIKLT